MTYTDEQLAIINSTEKSLDVKAGPGTGKTTLAVGYAKARPSKRILYIVYTDSSKQHARKRFSGNTTVHSAHSLAYDKIGIAYSDKIVNNLRVSDIVENIEELSIMNNTEEAYELAHTTLLILNSFLQSALSDFTALGFSGKEVSWAEEIFSKMIDQSNDMKMSQDASLKLFELMEVELDEYDTIIVDEKQDMNPVTASFISRFKGDVILIGDNDQTIFGFRGSRGLIHGRRAVKKNLTYSFRFGSHVSLIANLILQTFKQRKDYLISGVQEDSFWTFTHEKYTYITRTNSHIIEDAIKSVQLNKKVYFNGGLDNIIKDSIDVYYLYTGNKDQIKNRHIKKFKNFYSYKNTGKRTNDPEINYTVKLVEQFGTEFLNIISRIKENTLNSPNNADILYTSAHKSKGLEWENVKIANDYPSIFNKMDIPSKTIDIEEINILYVAATRAQFKLELNNDLKKLLDYAESNIEPIT